MRYDPLFIFRLTIWKGPFSKANEAAFAENFLLMITKKQSDWAIKIDERHRAGSSGYEKCAGIYSSICDIPLRWAKDDDHENNLNLEKRASYNGPL